MFLRQAPSRIIIALTKIESREDRDFRGYRPNDDKYIASTMFVRVIYAAKYMHYPGVRVSRVNYFNVHVLVLDHQSCASLNYKLKLEIICISPRSRASIASNSPELISNRVLAHIYPAVYVRLIFIASYLRASLYGSHPPLKCHSLDRFVHSSRTIRLCGQTAKRIRTGTAAEKRNRFIDQGDVQVNRAVVGTFRIFRGGERTPRLSRLRLRDRTASF